VQRSEFFAAMGVQDRPYARRMFSVFDRNASGEVDFGEFIVALWSFCTFTRAALAALAFSLLDTDGSGTLDEHEVTALVRDLSDDPNYAVDAHEFLQEGGGGGKKTTTGDNNHAAEAAPPAPAADAASSSSVPEERITEHMFLAFALKHPAVTLPALKLQGQLREAMGGEAFWLQASLRRAKAIGASKRSAPGSSTPKDALAAEEAEAEAAEAGARQEVERAKAFALLATESIRAVKDGGGGGGGRGSRASASVAPETAVDALRLLKSGSVSRAHVDMSAATEAHAQHVSVLGAITAATHHLAHGLDIVISLRSSKYGASKKKKRNTPESDTAVARKAARDKAAAEYALAQERAVVEQADRSAAAVKPDSARAPSGSHPA
jgi:hypothetical protein